jgi:hypothetical protein
MEPGKDGPRCPDFPDEDQDLIRASLLTSQVRCSPRRFAMGKTYPPATTKKSGTKKR